jgi:hypothetical protein
MKTNDTGYRDGSLWPLWGVAAGLLGIVAHMITMPDLTEADRGAGVEVMSLLTSGNHHVGVVAGMLAVFCILALAAGWRRWLAASAPESLASGIVPLAFTASAGALILAYGFKGMLAIYLPGGMDHGSHPVESLYPLFILDDMSAFMGWYGVAMAAGALAWVALRERQLPLWFGIISGLFALVPAVILVLFALPGFPGVIMPVWLVITGIGMTLSLRRSSAPVARRGVAVTAS